MEDLHELYYTRTDGYPVNTLLVTQNLDARPDVFAYVTDVNNDVFRVYFGMSRFVIDTSEGEMLMSKDTLFKLSGLNARAEKINTIIQTRISGSEGIVDFSDLITRRRPQSRRGKYLRQGE